jgi:two-component system chemotaxis response regulator CheY
MTKTILIVDDSDNLGLLVRFSLTSAGYEVVEAADGQVALNLLDWPRVSCNRHRFKDAGDGRV